MRTLLIAFSFIVLCQSGCTDEPAAKEKPAASVDKPASVPSSTTDPSNDEKTKPSGVRAGEVTKAVNDSPSGAPPSAAETDEKEAHADEEKAAEVQEDQPKARPLPVLPKLSPEEAQKTCMRACNKTHQCDFVRAGVALCVTRCLEAQDAGDDRSLLQEARLFRAQGGCADQKCHRFQACVVKSLQGQEAMTLEPPMSRDKTEAFCKPLCAKQKACEPEYFSNLPGGMVSCIASCQQVAIKPDAAAAAQRVVMRAAFDCIDKACGKPFGDCAQQNLIMPKTDQSSGTAP